VSLFPPGLIVRYDAIFAPLPRADQGSPLHGSSRAEQLEREGGKILGSCGGMCSSSCRGTCHWFQHRVPVGQDAENLLGRKG
jgi:hypothetical protein